MKNKLPIQSCKYVCLTDITPKEWDGWFYLAISEDAPFSWGDNNRTMVDAMSFSHHVQRVMDFHDEEEVNEKQLIEFYETLGELERKQVYIDLEN
jgi:hypothetical protein